ncbi:rhodanese-like domain-containing protein [Thermocrispum municipale]|jgi:rhodanese-related sulfurtransferase|uniref:rhodanese-like domain-containing protein n=1 Tax=Thermocrispum municipale TaxID=37926 RepID=UPI000416825B|nr:rhodanese-like domain-containing protein [Thermocrispum municipale]
MFAEDVPTTRVADLPDGEFPLLDVREDDEWRAGHAPTARHIPLRDLPARMAELAEFGDDQPIYVVCRTGGRSEQATAFLNANGFEACNVAGGMKSWLTEGRPVVAEDPNVEPTVL